MYWYLYRVPVPSVSDLDPYWICSKRPPGSGSVILVRIRKVKKDRDLNNEYSSSSILKVLTSTTTKLRKFKKEKKLPQKTVFLEKQLTLTEYLKAVFRIRSARIRIRIQPIKQKFQQCCAMLRIRVPLWIQIQIRIRIRIQPGNFRIN